MINQIKNILDKHGIKASKELLKDLTQQFDQSTTELNEKYRRLTENSPEITYINNLNKGALYWSSKIKNILGFDPNNIVEETTLWTKSLHPEDIPKIDQVLKNIKVGKTYELEYRIYDVNNNLHWFYDRIFNVYKKNGDLILEGIISDITEKKEIENQLKENEEKFRTITDSAQDAIILIDDKGIVVFWNKAATKILKYKKDEIMGRNLHQLVTPHKYMESYTKAFKSFIKTGKGNAINNSLELSAIRKDGVEIPVELSLSALKLNDTWHAVGILRDISERKKAKEQLQEHNKKLHNLNATKDKFFSIIAHDLRGPVNNLVGFSDLLEHNYQNYDKEKLSHLINLMNTSAKRTHDLLENLLIWSRSQRDKITFNPQSFICKELVLDVLQEMEHLAFAKGINFKIDKENKSHPVEVDKNMFKTVYRNLISNAIKYTNEGGIISIGCGKVTDKFVEFFVKDNGVGIPKETIEKLFKLDENITTEGTNQEHGTGLGLILCKDFVEKHGGKIWVESEVNNLPAGRQGGSTFWFTFPTSKK